MLIDSHSTENPLDHYIAVSTLSVSSFFPSSLFRMRTSCFWISVIGCSCCCISLTDAYIVEYNNYSCLFWDAIGHQTFRPSTSLMILSVLFCIFSFSPYVGNTNNKCPIGSSFHYPRNIVYSIIRLTLPHISTTKSKLTLLCLDSPCTCV